MKIEIKAPHKQIGKKIQLPASKSISNRALIIRALSNHDFKINNLSTSNDTKVLVQALSNLSQPVIDIGAAGTAMRFLTAFLSITPGERILTGSERMKQRPVNMLVNILRELGAQIEYLDKEGFPPIKIKGATLKSTPIKIKGNISSQFISALLMIAPSLDNGLKINIEDKILSKDYINMTIKMMQYHGINIQWRNQSIIINKRTYIPKEITVEPDWSAASYWFETISLIENAEVELHGLRQNSLQGDSVLPEIFKRLGVKSTFTQSGLQLKNTPETDNYFEYDFTNCPDLAQTLTVTLVAKKIPFKLTGLDNLSIKETDRINALVVEFEKTGVHLQTNGKDYISWEGNETIKIPVNHFIKTYDDHRMAMAFTPLSIVSKQLIIEDPDVVAKSYPEFWNDLEAFGFSIHSK